MSLTAQAGGSGVQEPGRLRAIAGEILESLYQHRLLSTGQLRVMHAPHASSRWMQRVLSELADQDLVRFAHRRGALRVWYVSEAGADLVEAVPDRVEERRKLLDPRHAAGMLQAHTLAVNDVGISFLEAARERGDEFTARSWRPEVAHPIGPPPGMRRGELLIADAVLSYLHFHDKLISVQYRFVELDRATIPVDKLAEKLARYARLYRFRPRAPRAGQPRPPAAWKARYPVFPGVLVAFADRPRRALERRAHISAALCRTDPDLTATGQVELSFCLLEDLKAKGPFAAIFTEPGREERVDWLGQPPDTEPTASPSDADSATAAADADGEA